MSKNLFARILFWLWATAQVIAVSAHNALRPFPPSLHPISDEVGVLSANEGAQLAGLLQDMLYHTGVKIVMVIAETTKPESSDAYAGRLVEHWTRRQAVDPARTVVVVLALRDRELTVMAGHSLPALQAEIARGAALSRDLTASEGRTLLRRHDNTCPMASSANPPKIGRGISPRRRPPEYG